MLEYTLVYQYKIDNHSLIFYLVYFFVSLWCDVYKYVMNFVVEEPTVQERPLVVVLIQMDKQ